jgi:hypothetical protein
LGIEADEDGDGDEENEDGAVNDSFGKGHFICLWFRLGKGWMINASGVRLHGRPGLRNAFWPISVGQSGWVRFVSEGTLAILIWIQRKRHGIRLRVILPRSSLGFITNGLGSVLHVVQFKSIVIQHSIDSRNLKS